MGTCRLVFGFVIARVIGSPAWIAYRPSNEKAIVLVLRKWVENEYG
jgi:hypothetical protein